MVAIPLKKGSFLLLRPEDVSGQESNAFYAIVKSARKNKTIVSKLMDDGAAGDEFTLDPTSAAPRVVLRQDAQGPRLGSWLRKAVCVQVDQAYLYGQVVDYEGADIVVQTRAERTKVPAANIVTEVYPVIAMVMQAKEWKTSECSASTLQDIHDALIDGLLGDTVLDGDQSWVSVSDWVRAAAVDMTVDTDAVFTWVEPESGVPFQTSLKHVVNYVYYVTGRGRVPPSMRRLIGHSFCDDPTVEPTTSTGTTSVATSSQQQPNQGQSDGRRSRRLRRAQDGDVPRSSQGHERRVSLFEPDIVDDEEENAQDERAIVSGIDSAMLPSHHSTCQPTVGRAPPIDLTANTDMDRGEMCGGAHLAADPDAELDFLDSLRRSRPHLVARYLERNASANAPSKRLRVSQATVPPPQKRSRYEFAPSPQQELVHGLITRSDHLGKSAFNFVEFVMAYPQFGFRVYPGVLVRAYDFQFGSRGLSILHFSSLGYKEGLFAQRDETISMTDFSAAAKILAPPQVASWSGLAGAVSGLLQYCCFCCDEATQDLVRALQTFVGDVEKWKLWEARDLPLLAMWIDSILEKYRGAVIADSYAGSSTRLTVAGEFSVFNRQLQTLLSSLLADRIADASTVERVPPYSLKTGSSGAPRHEHRTTKGDRRVPAHVLAVLPRQNNKELCLRHLSKRGCQSSDPSRCVNSDRVHARPSTLPKPVADYSNVQSTATPTQRVLLPLPRNGDLPVAAVPVSACRYASRTLTSQSAPSAQCSSTSYSAPSVQCSLPKNSAPSAQSTSEWQSPRYPPTQPVHTQGSLPLTRCGVQSGSKAVDVKTQRRYTRLATYSPTGQLPTYDALSQEMLSQLQDQEATDRCRLLDTFRRYNVECPRRVPQLDRDGRVQLDFEMQRALSQLMCVHGFTVIEVAELVRGQSGADYRPNKALNPRRYQQLLGGYEHQQFLISVASSGIDPIWSSPEPCQRVLPVNHKSADRHLNSVLKSIRRGQDAGQYLVLTDDVLPICGPVQISPLGAVEKNGVDASVEVRVIHDLSHPLGRATNDASTRASLPAIEYRHVAAVARRIEVCHLRFPHTRTYLMKGDVKGAFRHLMLAAAHVRWMAAHLPQQTAVVFDLAAPFGWTSSPACYGAFGGAISWLLGKESPATMAPPSADTDRFFAYEWVDDHILVEPDQGDRLFLADQTLRLAMLAVLGPRAVNEEKFSRWETQLEVLGLEFDTVARTVSMPQAKIAKALSRVQQIQVKNYTSRHDLQRLLGSLRHVCTCLRSARPFYQHLHIAMQKAHRHGRVTMTDLLRLDLQWFAWILNHGRLRALPTALFVECAPVDVHIYMDASDVGLVVLHPARRQYIQLRFDDLECTQLAHGSPFTINVRELFGVALAAWVFGPTLTSPNGAITLVRAWVDNTSAVSWNNRLHSSNPMAQELSRAIGLAEALYDIRISASHLPGFLNTMADAGSRAWCEPHRSNWANLSALWSQIPVPTMLRKIYSTFSMNFKPSQWPRARPQSTQPTGVTGAFGAVNVDTPSGYPTIGGFSLPSSSNLPFSFGNSHSAPDGRHLQPKPFCPNLARSHGIINGTADTRRGSTPDTKWLCEGCSGCHPDPRAKNPSPLASFDAFDANATSTSPTTAFSGGLRSWATSFSCAARSTSPQADM